jgi:hypothetical protein
VTRTKDAAAAAALTRAAQKNCALAGGKIAVMMMGMATVIATVVAGPGQKMGVDSSDNGRPQRSRV